MSPIFYTRHLIDIEIIIAITSAIRQLTTINCYWKYNYITCIDKIKYY